MNEGAGPVPDRDQSISPEPPRYRALRIVSLGLIVAGLVVTVAVLQVAPDALAGVADGGGAGTAAAMLAWLIAGGLALLVGLLGHAARSLVVREELPEWRYRGPSVLVVLVLAIVAANLAIIPAASDVAALLGDGELTTFGTLAILTVTQLGLVGAAALFALAPRALAGLRLLPEAGVWRSVAIGLVLAVPAWILAQLIGVAVIYVLDLLGLQPEVGVAEQALGNADPVVLVVALVGVAPVAEELFFRGFVYNAWLREYGPQRALIGSAVLFALIHGSVFLFLPIVVLGVALALVYRSTGSLPAAIALHAGFNAITVLLGLLARYGILELPVT